MLRSSTLLFAAALIAATAIALVPPARADDGPNPLASVVRVKASILADARTGPYLGVEREGSGVVIGADGLVLTIGYVILEAEDVEVTDAAGRTHPANVVAYDHATGFGLLRTVPPLAETPIEFGDSAAVGESEPVLVAGYGGPTAVTRAQIVSRRNYTGSWEYLLENAIFTAPPVMNWGGAALIGRDGKLLGIGSLLVPDAVEPGSRSPGNMFIPINALKPILADLADDGTREGPPRAWLGMSTEEAAGRLMVVLVAPDGPAARAGIQADDIVTAIDGETVKSQADLYRKLWAKGPAGTQFQLKVLKGAELVDVTVRSMNRADYLSKKPAL
jgi:S1-C subfamily serine protease